MRGQFVGHGADLCPLLPGCRISFAAVTLSTSPPGPSIERWTNPGASTSTAAKGKQKARQTHLDLSVLDALPADLRAEVLTSYGLSEEDIAQLLEQQRPAKRARPADTAPYEPGRGGPQGETTPPELLEPGDAGSDHALGQTAKPPRTFVDEGAESIDSGGTTAKEDYVDKDDREGGDPPPVDGTQPCPVCGLGLFPFAAAAHALYHTEDES